MKNTQE